MSEELDYLSVEEEDTQKDRYLTFKVGEEHFGLDIGYVVEIIGIQEITDIPNQPAYIRGVINLRGKIVPTMDIRLRFRKEAREYDDRTCIIVLNIEETPIGIVVDRVQEVLNIPGEQIAKPPEFAGDRALHFVRGIGRADDLVVMLLDVQKLLWIEECREPDILAV